MFLTLLFATFTISLVVCFIVERIFNKPIHSILHRLIPEEISSAWARYIKFALYVVGISGGVRVHQIERYINPMYNQDAPLVLDRNRWVLEVYRTVIESLQSIALMLLLFFFIAIVAYVFVRLIEPLKKRKEQKSDAASDTAAG